MYEQEVLDRMSVGDMRAQMARLEYEILRERDYVHPGNCLSPEYLEIEQLQKEVDSRCVMSQTELDALERQLVVAKDLSDKWEAAFVKSCDRAEDAEGQVDELRRRALKAERRNQECEDTLVEALANLKRD